jgi:microcystin-dependent protein
MIVLFTIIVMAIIIVLLYSYFLYQDNKLCKHISSENKLEHLTNLSNEAIQDIATVYNKNNMIVTDLTVTGNFNVIPKGVIVMWNGASITVPAGWALCDGNNGTPNLSNKFILAMGNKSLGTTGGAETTTVTLTANNLPAHAHNYDKYNADDNRKLNTGVSTPSQIHTNGNLFNTTSTSNTGGGQPFSFSIMPPYYVLAYIMKL